MILTCGECSGAQSAPWDCVGCGGVGYIGEDGPFYTELQKEAAVTQADIEEELRLWRRWKAGDKESLGPLMERFDPIVNKWFRRVSHAKLPPSALKGELELQLIKSFDRYDPHRGTKLSTWVEWNMPAIYRFVETHQNIGRIPEHRSRRITTFETAKGELTERLGREPSAMDLSDDLGWSIAEIGRMERELRKDLSQATDFEDMIVPGATDVEEAMKWVYYELTGRDRLVFEWLTGWGGKPVLTQTEISNKLGVSPATITQVRKNIVDKIKSAQGII